MKSLLLLRKKLQRVVIIAGHMFDNHLHWILGCGFIFPCGPFSSGWILEAARCAAAPLHRIRVE